MLLRGRPQLQRQQAASGGRSARCQPQTAMCGTTAPSLAERSGRTCDGLHAGSGRVQHPASLSTAADLTLQIQRDACSQMARGATAADVRACIL